jgi:hypothetical protein
MKDMMKISEFNKVSMEYLSAEYGGCLSVELTQNLREHDDLFNAEPYYFKDLKINSCISFKNGGAINIQNIKNMIIEGDTEIINSVA